MAAYYNEYDPFAAAWLRELIKGGYIADGEVDERSITEVVPADVTTFTQCHFFAGIGGWSYALRLAGWEDTRPVWTGSCPCQPFSDAGRNKGLADTRHLWPQWFALLRDCKPDVIFGEQVEAAIAHGWLDLVRADLEGDGYALGVVGLPAASVNAYHQRHRLWWVAESRQQQTWRGLHRSAQGPCTDQGGTPSQLGGSGSAVGRVAHPNEWIPLDEVLQRCGVDGLRTEGGRVTGDAGDAQRQEAEWLADPGRPADERRGGPGEAPAATGSVEGEAQQWERRGAAAGTGVPLGGVAVVWIPCRDGKSRPVEPGTFPLAHGVPARVGRLRGYGNAIHPTVAAEFIAAYMAVHNV